MQEDRRGGKEKCRVSRLEPKLAPLLPWQGFLFVVVDNERLTSPLITYSAEDVSQKLSSGDDESYRCDNEGDSNLRVPREYVYSKKTRIF